jgi:GTPase SAR1 family protein
MQQTQSADLETPEQNRPSAPEPPPEPSREPSAGTADRNRSLEAHLKQENPVLLEALKNFRKLDRVGQRMGFLAKDETYTLRISWWPVISLLGTFSSGKSTFINHYLGQKLQNTGNQAVDDRFTVICYSAEQQIRTLPGSALNADPRFPFYRIGSDIEQVERGQGARINSYLQLKACPSDKLKAKILLDSPGFDADKQRDATLRITDHIIDLSDLVLVMFDARHPEPGSMRDTLKHLVGNTVSRPDASKFLYILNQIDTTANEDNPEDIVGSWQRALASYGLTAGRFFRIYDEEVAAPMRDEGLAARFKNKKDEDMGEIYRRMREVEIDRAYRVVNALVDLATTLHNVLVPRLCGLRDQWRRRVWTYDGIVVAILAAALIACLIAFPNTSGDAYAAIGGGGVVSIITGIVLFFGGLGLHFLFLRLAARQIVKKLRKAPDREVTRELIPAFIRNTHWSKSLFFKQPVGWGMRARRLVRQTMESRTEYVQTLNDRYTNPSGRKA